MSLDSNRNKTYTEFEDIVQELSEEFEIPYQEIEEICSLNLEYVKQLTHDKEVLSILLPELGNLYYSERFGEFYTHRESHERRQRFEKKRELVKFLKYRTKLIEEQEEEKEIRKSNHRRKPLLYKFKNIYKKLYNGKIVRAGATVGHQELWTKFSEIQNNIQNGKKNDYN